MDEEALLIGDALHPGEAQQPFASREVRNGTHLERPGERARAGERHRNRGRVPFDVDPHAGFAVPTDARRALRAEHQPLAAVGAERESGGDALERARVVGEQRRILRETRRASASEDLAGGRVSIGIREQRSGERRSRLPGTHRVGVVLPAALAANAPRGIASGFDGVACGWSLRLDLDLEDSGEGEREDVKHGTDRGVTVEAYAGAPSGGFSGAGAPLPCVEPRAPVDFRGPAPGRRRQPPLHLET